MLAGFKILFFSDISEALIGGLSSRSFYWSKHSFDHGISVLHSPNLLLHHGIWQRGTVSSGHGIQNPWLSTL